MATKEEIYVSFNKLNYKKNKANLLESKANLLRVLKHLHHLKVLARQRNDLKKRLEVLTSSVLNNINSLQEKIPKSNIPKGIIEEEKIEKMIKESKKVSTRKDYSSLDEELAEINKKLKNLHMS